MSDDLHPTRLWWCASSGRGIARHDGVEVRLRTRPPVLRGSRVVELEYLPALSCMYVQEAVGQHHHHARRAARALGPLPVDEIGRAHV